MKHLIAVIDDDTFFGSETCRDLEAAGYRTVSANTPTEWDCILALRGNQAPELFIVDIHMPHDGRYSSFVGADIGYTGFFLARDIRKRFRTRPIIFYSSYPRKHLYKKARRVARGLGNCLCFDKGAFSSPEVIEQLDSYFQNGKLRRTFLERLRDSFIARPSFAGFGIDLTKL